MLRQIAVTPAWPEKKAFAIGNVPYYSDTRFIMQSKSRFWADDHVSPNMNLNDPQLYGLMFEVNGHTDVSGRLGYNISLSMLRASAVVDYLAARGVPRERMRPQGFGPLQPFDPYNLFSPANRRVEIVALR